MPALDYAAFADLYDACVRFDGDLAFFVEVARRHDRPADGGVLELMAGTGRVSLPLAEAGVALTAVDLVPAMLAVLHGRARERGLAPQLCCADVGRLPFVERFSLALLPFQGFGELLDEAEQRRALAAVHRALLPGGRFVLTLHNPPVRLAGVTGEWTSHGRWPRPGGAGTVELRTKTRWDPDREQVTGLEQLRCSDATGRLEEERTLPLAFSLVGRERFEALATASGFSVRSLAGDLEGGGFEAGVSPLMVWTLERRP